MNLLHFHARTNFLPFKIREKFGTDWEKKLKNLLLRKTRNKFFLRKEEQTDKTVMSIQTIQPYISFLSSALCATYRIYLLRTVFFLIQHIDQSRNRDFFLNWDDFFFIVFRKCPLEDVCRKCLKRILKWIIFCEFVSTCVTLSYGTEITKSKKKWKIIFFEGGGALNGQTKRRFLRKGLLWPRPNPVLTRPRSCEGPWKDVSWVPERNEKLCPFTNFMATLVFSLSHHCLYRLLMIVLLTEDQSTINWGAKTVF